MADVRSLATSAFGTHQPPEPRYRGIVNHSLYLPMRDGVRLAVEVNLPADLPPGVRIPTLLEVTRYWRSMEVKAPFSWFLGPDDLIADWKPLKPFFTSRGYALVSVDERGTGASFGRWPHPWPETLLQDAAEVVDWIVAQPWSSGAVGGWGASYLGTAAELLGALRRPAIRALLPSFNQSDPYLDIALPGGVLNERFMRQWSGMDRALDQNRILPELGLAAWLVVKGVKPVEGSDARKLLAEALRDHAGNGDVYSLTQQVMFRDDRQAGVDVSADDLAVHRHRQEIVESAVPTMGWASWMDAGTADAALRRFLTHPHVIRTVIGAWEHGGRFNASPYRAPGAKVSPELPAQWAEMIRFFDAHLKGHRPKAGGGPDEGKLLYYYTLGAEQWRQSSVWPPAGTQMQRWYLGEQRTLLPSRPTGSGADTYAVDFEAGTGPTNRWWEMNGAFDQTVSYPDRARADRRLLCYTSAPLEADAEISGYPVVTLYLASTEPDGVLFVYLEDVDEGREVTYVTEGQLRVIHRRVSTEPGPYVLQVPYHSFKRADAMPLVPGEPAEITFGLLPVSALVRKGHRLRVAIAGHNKGTFARIPPEGTPVLTVAWNEQFASYIDLPVVQGR